LQCCSGREHHAIRRRNDSISRCTQSFGESFCHIRDSAPSDLIRGNEMRHLDTITGSTLPSKPSPDLVRQPMTLFGPCVSSESKPFLQNRAAIVKSIRTLLPAPTHQPQQGRAGRGIVIALPVIRLNRRCAGGMPRSITPLKSRIALERSRFCPRIRENELIVSHWFGSQLSDRSHAEMT
jgi:hypothetical protein